MEPAQQPRLERVWCLATHASRQRVRAAGCWHYGRWPRWSYNVGAPILQRLFRQLHHLSPTHWARFPLGTQQGSKLSFPLPRVAAIGDATKRWPCYSHWSLVPLGLCSSYGTEMRLRCLPKVEQGIARRNPCSALLKGPLISPKGGE